MSMNAPAPALDKARPSRADEERATRRRRDETGIDRHNPLAVSGELDPNFVYRWINDEPGRVHALTQLDDWDPVTSEQLGERHAKDKQIGSGVERIVERATGKKALLVRKRKEFYAEDRAKEQLKLDELDAAIRNGGGSQSPDSVQSTGKAYIPQGGIVIQDGRKR